MITSLVFFTRKDKRGQNNTYLKMFSWEMSDQLWELKYEE